MKILLRNYQGEPYVWKDAKYNKNRFIVNDTTVDLANIVSVYRDNRKKYVQCSNCHQTFIKGSVKAIQHTTMPVNKNNCSSCGYLYYDRPVTKIRKVFKSQEDNTDLVTETFKTKLMCRYAGNYALINDVIDKKHCYYQDCVNTEMVPIIDFFTEYPNAFDNVITVDKIAEHGYKTKRYDGQNTIYLLYDDGYHLEAIVNNLNIVDCFYVMVQGTFYKLYYSKKFSQLYYKSFGDTYHVWHSSYITQEQAKTIAEKIASLYE